MNKQNKKGIMQGLTVVVLLIAGFLLYRDVQSNVEQAAVAPSAEVVTSGAVTSPDETQGNLVTSTDSTPNYDPDDPFGVKFGATLMGGLFLVIIVQWLVEAVIQAVNRKHGGG